MNRIIVVSGIIRNKYMGTYYFLIGVFLISCGQQSDENRINQGVTKNKNYISINEDELIESLIVYSEINKDVDSIQWKVINELGFVKNNSLQLLKINNKIDLLEFYLIQPEKNYLVHYNGGFRHYTYNEIFPLN